MGIRGPIPKRAEERRRRNKTEQDTTITMRGTVKRVACPAGVHPDSRTWFLSLSHSGQSQYYEPSDWQQARILTLILSKLLNSSRVSAQLFAAWCSAASELGTTEGARRRLHIEVERKADKPALAEVSVMEEYRNALGG